MPNFSPIGAAVAEKIVTEIREKKHSNVKNNRAICYYIAMAPTRPLTFYKVVLEPLPLDRKTEMDNLNIYLSKKALKIQILKIFIQKG